VPPFRKLPLTVLVADSTAPPTPKTVGSDAPPTLGSSVGTVALFTPSLLLSNETVPWLLTVVPWVPLLMVAVMVMVTLPPSGASEPSQLTVLPAVAAVPDVAVALTRVSPAGRVSVNS